jgi:hypothetical protein
MIYVIYMMVYDYMICVIVSTKPIKAQIPDFLGDKHKKSLVAKKKSGISISALSPQSLYNIHQKKTTRSNRRTSKTSHQTNNIYSKIIPTLNES